MLREEFVKRINDKWRHDVYQRCYVGLKNFATPSFGLFFSKRDEESDKDYYCYASVDRHGKPYVHVYDTAKECDANEMKDNPIIDFFDRIKCGIRDRIFNIQCYFQRAKEGYCEKDLYDISGWFLSIMPKMLRDLKTKCSYVPIGDDGEIIHPFNKHNIRIPFIYRDAGFGFTCIIDNNSRNGFSGKLDMVHAGEFSFGYDCRKRSLHMMGDTYGTFTDIFIHDDNSYTVDYDDNEIKKDTLDLLIELFNKALIEYQNKNEGNCLGEHQNWQQLLEKMADLFDRANYEEDDKNPYDIIKDKEKYDNYETNKHHYKAMKLKEGFELFTKYFRRLGWQMRYNMSNKLYKGIFWFKDFDDISQNSMYYRLPCDEKGNVKENNYDKDVFGKTGNNFNHKKFWDTLPSNVTNNKSFDYYPRGRVEISNGKAIIFITQDLVDYQNDVTDFIKEKFNLRYENGITKIDVKFDGSSHYKSKLGEI